MCSSDLKAVITFKVSLDRFTTLPKVLVIAFNNQAIPILSSQIHTLLKWGLHIIRFSTLVINPLTLVINNCIKPIIRFTPPMVRIIRDRTNGGKVMLNQGGVQVKVLIEGLVCLLILSYLSLPRWNFRMYLN